MKIDIKYLIQIEALNRHRNFGRAAKELNISQPGLSQSINNLEHLIGYRLFDRNSREITPTIFGKRILEAGTTILRDSDQLEKDLSMMAKLESGTIRIGIGPLAADVILGKSLGNLFANHPKLHVRTTVDWVPSLLDQLTAGVLDVIIGDTRFIDDKEPYRIHPLPTHTACFVCRPEHPVLRQENVVLKDIFKYPIATPKLPELVIKTLAKISDLDFNSMADFPNGLIEAPYHLLTETISRCDAVGIGIIPVFAKQLEAGQLVQLPIVEKSLQTSYEIISLKRYSQSPAVTIFHEFVIDVCKQLHK